MRVFGGAELDLTLMKTAISVSLMVVSFKHICADRSLLQPSGRREVRKGAARCVGGEIERRRGAERREGPGDVRECTQLSTQLRK
jgi:hypothetical protein